LIATSASGKPLLASRKHGKKKRQFYVDAQHWPPQHARAASSLRGRPALAAAACKANSQRLGTWLAECIYPCLCHLLLRAKSCSAAVLGKCNSYGSAEGTLGCGG